MAAGLGAALVPTLAGETDQLAVWFVAAWATPVMPRKAATIVAGIASLRIMFSPEGCLGWLPVHQNRTHSPVRVARDQPIWLNVRCGYAAGRSACIRPAAAASSRSVAAR